jgi:hypothetical protein
MPKIQQIGNSILGIVERCFEKTMTVVAAGVGHSLPREKWSSVSRNNDVG